ncbi:MAG: type I methionyl aminopeptidase [Actinobacteria bacterium]|nr:type I methionyl aminopeptidase [Actinomycetota bacterium]
MREAGLIVAESLDRVRQAVAPGVTTLELDAIAESCIRDAGATPSFLGYYGYPASICVSVNDEVVHGIPGGRVLAQGDLVSVDCGAIVDGWHGDAAISVPVGAVSPEVQLLSDVTREALWAGLRAVVDGARLGDVGAAVQESVHGADHPYGIVVDYVGHGIGSSMHMPPNVPNIGTAGSGPKLVIGMAVAIEPMITMGTAEVEVLDDDWTVVTADGLAAAHWEHTIALTEDGPVVMTAFGADEL